jgi:hypothetical protein
MTTEHDLTPIRILLIPTILGLLLIQGQKPMSVMLDCTSAPIILYGKRVHQDVTVVTLIARNATEALVTSMEESGRVCSRSRNGSTASLCKDDAAIN